MVMCHIVDCIRAHSTIPFSSISRVSTSLLSLSRNKFFSIDDQWGTKQMASNVWIISHKIKRKPLLLKCHTHNKNVHFLSSLFFSSVLIGIHRQIHLAKLVEFIPVECSLICCTKIRLASSWYYSKSQRWIIPHLHNINQSFFLLVWLI